MLLRLFTAAGDGEEYRRVLKRRCILFGVLIALGLATIAGAYFLGNSLPDFVRGFYPGVGTGAGLCGAAGLFGTRRTLRDEKKLRAEQIKETDERGKEVTLRSASTTVLILIAVAYVALMVAVAVDLTVFFTLLGTILLFFAIFLSAHVYYNKKL